MARREGKMEERGEGWSNVEQSRGGDIITSICVRVWYNCISVSSKFGDALKRKGDDERDNERTSTQPTCAAATA